MGKLDGKVALISGGAKGQGAAEVRTFAREGARVVFGDILDAEGKKVEEAIRAEGGEAAYVHLDVTSEVDWQNAVKLATGRHGRLDILVNNAGIVIPRVAIEDRTAAEWDRVMQSAIIAPVKFDTPTKRTRPEDTTSSSARMVSSNGVEASGQCTSKTSTQSVRSRFRLRSISRKTLARLASRSGPSWPGGGGFTPHLVTRITSRRRFSRARATTSSEWPPPYAGAVSTQFTPLSSARWIALTASSSSIAP